MSVFLDSIFLIGLPVCAGYDALHELVEERHGECGVSVARAPDHAFGDDALPQRRKCTYRFTQDGRDVAGTVRACPQFGHCPKILLFSGSESVETDPKEALIKSRDGLDRGDTDIVQRDWAALCNIPRMLAPLLQEIRISVGLCQHLRDGLWCVDHTFVASRFFNGYTCLSLLQSIDDWELE